MMLALIKRRTLIKIVSEFNPRNFQASIQEAIDDGYSLSWQPFVFGDQLVQQMTKIVEGE